MSSRSEMVAASVMRSRRMNGRSEPSSRGGPFAELVERRLLARRCGASARAEVQPPVGGDGVDAVVARADRQAAGGVEERDLGCRATSRGDVEDPLAADLEEQRRRHQPHRRVVVDEEGGDAGGGEEEKEEDLAQAGAVPGFVTAVSGGAIGLG